MTTLPSHGITVRALVSGFVLAVLLCGMNSYLTLSFGVIEEGPTIAALFFFAVFCVSKTRITVPEMVIVATMGSAGGSLGFISNFFAAKAMTGEPYTVLEMFLFALVTSLVGLAMVVPLRQLLILRETLPWPGSKAVAGVIRALVEEGDPRQPRILFATLAVLFVVVVINSDHGFALIPDATPLGLGLAAYGGVIAWSPFALGGAYLMGLRTCVGFLVGAVTLMTLSRLEVIPTENASSPHLYFWPGLGFLVASGLTSMALNWRTLAAAFRSISAIGAKQDDDDPIMSGRTLFFFATTAFVIAAVVLNVFFGVSILLVILLIAVGGLVQNIIATRAAAQTAFNPARVMGILLQAVTSMAGGSSTAVNLTGAGFVAGSGAQAGNLTGDMAYGRWFKIPSSRQFWAQCLTIVPCALVAAFVFEAIQSADPLLLDGGRHSAPVAKMWAASALIFDGRSPLPAGAWTALAIGAGVGVLYTLLERIDALRPRLPDSIGIGLGMVLWAGYSISFFLGGVLMWIVLGRWLRWREVTLTTIAVAAIVAEGLGGVTKPLLKLTGIIATEAAP